MITVRFHGLLADWITYETVEFHLKTRPTYQDLLKKIGRRFGEEMPEQLWDPVLDKFNDSVVAVGLSGRLDSLKTALNTDETVVFYLMLAGG